MIYSMEGVLSERGMSLTPSAMAPTLFQERELRGKTRESGRSRKRVTQGSLREADPRVSMHEHRSRLTASNCSPVFYCFRDPRQHLVQVLSRIVLSGDNYRRDLACIPDVFQRVRFQQYQVSCVPGFDDAKFVQLGEKQSGTERG